MARTVNCIKLGMEAEGLDFPPYPGELGKRIWQGVSKQAWAQCGHSGNPSQSVKPESKVLGPGVASAPPPGPGPRLRASGSSLPGPGRRGAQPAASVFTVQPAVTVTDSEFNRVPAPGSSPGSLA